MKKRIFIYYFILVFSVLLVSMFFTTQIAQKYYKDEVENKLQSVAFSLNYFLQKDNEQGETNYDQLAKDYAKKQNTNQETDEDRIRITFVDYAGKVLGDSEVDPKMMENHLNRKEIQQALQESRGNDIRFSKTVSANFLYVATSVENLQVVIRVSVPFVQINKINAMIRYYSFIIFSGALLLSILISLRITDNITRSLNSLTIASKEIANGNYTQRIQVKASDELGQLATNFNEMAAKLDTTIADLHNKKVEMESIIDSMKNGLLAVDAQMRIILINPPACQFFGIGEGTHLIGDKLVNHIRNNQINTFLKETIVSNQSMACDLPYEHKLLHINTSPIRHKQSELSNYGALLFIQDMTKVRKLERLRTEFVSNVTHELKTPITSIRGFVETLKHGAIHNQKVATRFLDIIDIEAERLNGLIEDILQLSEIESRQKDTDVEKCNIGTLAAEVFAILQPLALEKQIVLQYHSQGDVFLDANKNRMKQLLLNLVENGIKYNKAAGRVDLTAAREKGKVIITVADTGIGIPEEDRTRIFERFYRVDKGRSREMGGTGLGLSIVKHIVNLYYGDIKVESKLERGTTFILQFPS